jgi:hypothetical protein
MPAPILIPALASVIGGGAAAGAAVYGAKKNSKAAETAARYQTQQANYGADLEAKSAQAALDFAKQQEAQRHAEFQSTQDQNYQLWLAEQAKDDGRYNDRRARLDPYAQWGVGAIGQIMRPIPGSGSIGSIARG